MRSISLTLLMVAGCSTGVEESRAEALEVRATQLETELEAANATISDLTTRLIALESADVPANAADLTALEGDVSTLSGTVTAGGAALGTLSERVGSAEAAVAANSNGLADLAATTTQQALDLTATNTELDEVATVVSVMNPANQACPVGMTTAVLGDFCFDIEPSSGDPETGPLQCGTRGAYVCSGSQWMQACHSAEQLFEQDAPEFVDDLVTGDGHAKFMVKTAGATCNAIAGGETGVPDEKFRCCREKASLVYGMQ